MTLLQRLQNAWWNRPRRMAWETRRQFLRDRGEILVDRLQGKVLCALGKHQVKFGTAPRCYRCEKVVR